MSTTAMQTRLSPQIQELELEQFVLQLEVDGLCVVPPERTGVAPETINAIAEQQANEQIVRQSQQGAFVNQFGGVEQQHPTSMN